MAHVIPLPVRSAPDIKHAILAHREQAYADWLEAARTASNAIRERDRLAIKLGTLDHELYHLRILEEQGPGAFPPPENL